MDIFGIGFAEMIIICLVIILVAGPQRSAQWARQAGYYMAQLRNYLNAMMDEFENEIGDDGREIVSAARDLQREAREIRNMANPRQAVEKLSREVKGMPSMNERRAARQSDAPDADNGSQAAPETYPGWSRADDEDAEAPSAPDEDTEA